MRPHRQIRIDKDSEVTDCCRWCHRGRADHQTRSRESMLITASGQPQKGTKSNCNSSITKRTYSRVAIKRQYCFSCILGYIVDLCMPLPVHAGYYYHVLLFIAWH